MEYAWDNSTIYIKETSCTEWLEAQNFSFHISMLLYLAAYLIPTTYSNFLPIHRFLLIAAVLIHVVWGSYFWCTYDFIFWGCLLLLENCAHFVTILYSLRKVKSDKELESLYSNVFAPYKVSRKEFKGLVGQNCKTIRNYPGDKYAVENCTSVDERVSILLKGSMRVTYRGEYLHDIKPHDFIDSVEWDVSKVKRGEVFQVSIETVERCTYLCWNREKLQFYLQAVPKLETVFEVIRGHDVFEKIHGTAANAYRRNIKNFEEKCDTKVKATNIRTGIVADDPKAIYSEQQAK